MTDVTYQRETAQVADEERDIRVEDYLNDKLQNSTDLANIDTLLEDVKAQQVLLQKQLQDAKATLNETTNVSQTHSHELRERARSHKSQQADIDRRLLIVTRSETSDDAVQTFDSSMENLRKLDVARGYIELLTEVENLSSEARRNFRISPKAALKPYLKLQNLVNALKEAQPAAEDAAPHLIDHVDETARTLWKQMKDTFASDFEATLKKMGWPRADISMDESLEQEWNEGVKKLLELQEPELKARDNQETKTYSVEERLVLLPLEVMARPLELRFKYHFEGDRPTNRLDKPEYFFSHVIGLVNDYQEFFTVYLQPLLRDHFKRSNLALTSIYIDSTSALITALLPMLRRKIFVLLPRISNQPQLLSHLMHELMNFDVNMREEWDYDGGNAIEGWKGLTWEVLIKKGWFGRWLEVEKNFTLSRYQSIVDAPESDDIDYDSVDPGATKPTYAAIRVNDLLETITDRYRTLTSLDEKIEFLINIQITIFSLFHSRLHDSLQAYLSQAASIARTVHGISKEAQGHLRSFGGLERLCRVYGSAEHLERKMSDWSDDIFFLELWDELQDRALADSGRILVGSMSLQYIEERTSGALGHPEESGTLFDVTAGNYQRLRTRAEAGIQDMLSRSIRELLRPYGSVNLWSSLSSSVPSNSLALSAELDATVQQLNEYLSFLAKTLSQAPLRRIVRHIALIIQTYLWDSVLMRNTFSASGIAQFQRDVDAVWGTINRWVGDGQGEMSMRKLKEALILMQLPVETEDGDEGDKDVGPTLQEVDRKVFEDQAGAREALDELGFEVLELRDVRNVLQRMIELGD